MVLHNRVIFTRLQGLVFGYGSQFRTRLGLRFLAVVHQVHCHSALQLAEGVDAVVVVSVLPGLAVIVAEQLLLLSFSSKEELVVLRHDFLADLDEDAHGLPITSPGEHYVGEQLEAVDEAAALLLGHLLTLSLGLGHLQFFRMFHLLTGFFSFGLVNMNLCLARGLGQQQLKGLQELAVDEFEARQGELLAGQQVGDLVKHLSQGSHLIETRLNHGGLLENLLG
mmetsp:Transcript_11609/g.17573  ORF Transcript_11609/g.17573 Transcript_11609/m.17573 type:complete len:224 (-) Transcript_11609:1885-2556(-)